MDNATDQIVLARSLLRSGVGKTLRQRVCLSVAELAERVGVAPSTLLRWEEGAVPRGPAAARYAAALGELLEVANHAEELA